MKTFNPKNPVNPVRDVNYWGFGVRYNPAMSGKPEIRIMRMIANVSNKIIRYIRCNSLYSLTKARRVFSTSCRFNISSEQRAASSEGKTVTSSENRVAREIKNPIYSLLSTHYYSSILTTHYSLLTNGALHQTDAETCHPEFISGSEMLKQVQHDNLKDSAQVLPKQNSSEQRGSRRLQPAQPKGCDYQLATKLIGGKNE